MPQSVEKFLPNTFARAGSAALVLTSLACALAGEPLAAAAAAAGAGLCLTSSPLHRASGNRLLPQMRYFFLAALASVLAAALWLEPLALSHWLYVLPLAAFSVLPVPLATLVTLAVLASVLFATPWLVMLPERHQLAGAFVLTTLLAGVLVFLREFKSRQLAPLRRTHELTQAASREYLSTDLHKEIQRSEREGTNLAVMMIGLDTHLSDSAPDEDIRAILPRIGRYLHSQLRDFDTYYRVADLQFLVVLPGASTAETTRTADQIRQGLDKLMASHGLNLTISTGVAGLNIGDDADSLQQSVANALRRAQQQGGNRTQTYSTRVPAEVSNPIRPEASGP
ncbi:MAG TPA: GGDEF domain-containing protein [Marinobacter sp.]|nr:GGDEF domain-containing protein [Marinobacter sp.]